MNKPDYKVPNIKVVTVQITHQVCQNSIGSIDLKEGSDILPDYSNPDGYDL